MRIAQINSTCGVGSTGKICDAISDLLDVRNIENYIFYTVGKAPKKKSGYIKYGSDVYTKMQALRSHIFGNYGFNSKKTTKKLIGHLDAIKPDVVHLHNLHSHNCDLEMLFGYFKKNKVKLVWTFHDCWAFTGYCPHFTLEECEKWKTECKDCPVYKGFSFFRDKSNSNYCRKRELFSDLDVTVVTPSKWLAGLVKESFFKNAPVRVINNGIDLDTFKICGSDFKKKLGCQKEYLVLGVAYEWGKSKGLDVFIELSKRLPERYKIVLVGTNDAVDKELSENIISIHKTDDQKQLAEIYSAADVFVNPTRQEVFGLVNIEALACGTPVVMFNTGGSPECIDDSCGISVACEDIDAMLDAVIDACELRHFSQDDCVNRASLFDERRIYEAYAELYCELYNTKNSKADK